MKRTVIYISKQFQKISEQSSNDQMFPFLKNNQFQDEAHKNLAFRKIYTICNLHNIKQYIPYKNTCQQFVIFGRSNVGKSTLINRLIGKPITEISKKPGKTKQLAFLQLQSEKQCYMVDAPGYGYASAASKLEIAEWGKLITYYLRHTPKDDNQYILCLVDFQHGIKNVDMMLWNMLKFLHKKFILVFTKCDKIKGINRQKIILQKGQKIAKQLQEQYQGMDFYVHFTSCKKQGFGIQQLRNHLLFRLLQHQLIK